MTNADHEAIAPADQALAERHRALQPAFDRFEGRHYVGLAASLALHLAILMGLKWAIEPQPPRPLLVEVEMLPAEPVKASPLSRMAKAKPLTKETSPARQKVAQAKPPKPEPMRPDQEMTLQVIQAAPAKPKKRGVKGKAAAPAVALPDASSPVMGTSRAVPGQAPAAAAYQQAERLGTKQPRVASAGQQASSRQSQNALPGVETEKGPSLIASNTPAAQTLAPEHRHSSQPGGQFSSAGGAPQPAMGGGPRSEAAQPYSLQASGAGSSSLPARGVQQGARASAPVATGVARSGALTPNEARAGQGQMAAATAGAAISPEQARAGGTAARGAVASAAETTAGSSGLTPTEIRSSGGQQAAAGASPVTSGAARTGGGASGGAAAAASSGSGAGGGAPGEETAVAGLQAAGRGPGGAASAGRGAGAGDFSRPGAVASRGGDEGGAGGTQLLASAATSRGVGPAVQSMSAVIVPERRPAMVAQVEDDYAAAPMQRSEAQAVAHNFEEERYQAKSVKVNSPRTICELPLMLAGFDRKPLPEGLASIMGSDSAMVMESPPELLPGNLQPTYPPAAMIGNHKGIVTIRAQVLPSGQVGEMFVRPPRMAPVLEQAAMETIRRWRFKPARRNGEPVSAWVNIPIEYRNPT
jgi:TonB family protein